MKIKLQSERPDRVAYLRDIGTYYYLNEIPDSAFKHFKLGTIAARQLGDKYYEAYFRLWSGIVLNIKSEYNSALDYLIKAQELALQTDSSRLLSHSHKLKTDYFTQIQDFPSAYETMQIRIALKDSLFSQESGESIAKLENRITEEQRLNEIENLRKNRIDTRRLFMVIFIALVLIMVIIFISLRSSRNKNKILSEQFREISNQRVQLELKNEELIRSQAELSKINEDKNNFMTIISHDLKNPLSAIRGFLELLIMRFEVISDADKKKFLQEVFDSVEKISLLINNILFWGKSQTSGFRIKNEDFDIFKRVKDNLSLYQIIARSKNITLTNHIPKDIIVHTDKNIFDTIIRNLVSNSLKFTDKGGNITFKCETEESNIKIRIIDNGVGIEPKKLEDILNDKIYYTTSGTKHELGTGLGLSLCKAFVGILNGDFSINSEPGKGTEIIISLPYIKKDDPVLNPV
jgi:signal transduction histidine kinase